MAETSVDRVTLEISISDTASAKIDDLTSKIQNLINQVNILNGIDINTENFGKATPQVQQLSAQIQNVSNNTKTAEKSIDKLKYQTKSLGNSANSASKGFGKLFSAIKRVAFYRFIRAMIKEITEAIKEGTNNIYQFSKQFGDKTFSQNMDNMSSSLLYLKNSIGAVSAQLLNLLSPALTEIIDKIADFNNGVAELIAYLKGEQTYTKAIKLATEYAKATNEVAKANRNAVASFDELNVIRTSKNSDSLNDNMSKMFEEAAVDETNVKKTISNLKKIGVVLAGLGIAKIIWGIVRAMNAKNSALGAQTTKTGKETSAVKAFAKALVPVTVAVGAYALSFDKIPDWIQTTVEVVKTEKDKVTDFFEKKLPDWVAAKWTAAVQVSLKKYDEIKEFFSTTLPNWVDKAAFKIGKTVFTLAFAPTLITSKITSKLKDFFGLNGKSNNNFGYGGKSLGNAAAGSGVFAIITQMLTSLLPALAFASGGFPTTGQMFIARESGAEFVGSIGNRTAVANNDQIVEAVSLGVYNAVVDAMSNSQRNQGKQSIIINGREIFSVVQEESAMYRRRTGQTAF